MLLVYGRRLIHSVDSLVQLQIHFVILVQSGIQKLDCNLTVTGNKTFWGTSHLSLEMIQNDRDDPMLTSETATPSCTVHMPEAARDIRDSKQIKREMEKSMKDK